MAGSVAVDAKGNVYIADWQNERIRKINPAGVTSTVAGNGQRGYSHSKFLPQFYRVKTTLNKVGAFCQGIHDSEMNDMGAMRFIFNCRPICQGRSRGFESRVPLYIFQ